MIRRLLAPATLVLLLALSAACDDGGGTSTSSRTVRAGSPAPTVGIGELDLLIRAAYAGDEIELAGLTGYFETPCTSDSNLTGPNQPPPCREDETDGERVQVLPSSTCENGWVRPEQAPDAYAANFPDSGLALYAIFVPKVDFATYGGGFGATHVLVFDAGRGEGDEGAALWVDGGRIVWLRGVCERLDELIAPEDVSSYVIEPKGGATPPPGTPEGDGTAAPATPAGESSPAP